MPGRRPFQHEAEPSGAEGTSRATRSLICSITFGSGVRSKPTCSVELPATTVPSPAEIASGANAADFTARPAQNVFEAQVALARQAISSGSLDGVSGPKTRLALAAFQQKEDLPATGELDASTKSRLLLTSPDSNRLTILDAATLSLVASIEVGQVPFRIVVAGP